MSDTYRVTSSFRDPSGFLFSRQGVVYRQVNKHYQENYRLLVDSGLYAALTQKGLLLPHQEVDQAPPEPDNACMVICPQQLDFISYPYEWSFSQLKDAALTTLAIQKHALEYRMWLKDSSAYNIQFIDGKPILIDTLSFEEYPEGSPWVAYRQFCQHFLSPLALVSYCDVRLSQLLRIYIDGIPLDLTSKLLPARSWLSGAMILHVHLHSSSQLRYANQAIDKASVNRKMTKVQLLGLIDSLEIGVKKLHWAEHRTEWANYYEEADHYSKKAIEHKKEIVNSFLDRVTPKSVWDLGANAGLFSRLASDRGIPTLAFDIDPGAVEQNYLQTVHLKEKNLLPLVLDLTNPSPALGWNCIERMSLVERGPVDVVFALALIHHLAISNNVPFDLLASFFSTIGKWLVVEFIPKSDPQVKLLLTSRKDIFSDYQENEFEEVFSKEFEIVDSIPIDETQRKMYLMKRRIKE